MTSLASSQDTLREAVDQLNRALAPGANRTWRKDDAQTSQGTGFFIPPSDTTDSLHQVVLALQSKIQQLVLDQALMERDQSVPPRLQDRWLRITIACSHKTCAEPRVRYRTSGSLPQLGSGSTDDLVALA